MLRALQERFGLKTHRETREVPAWALTVAKGGLKLQKEEIEVDPTRPCWGSAAQTKEWHGLLVLNCSMRRSNLSIRRLCRLQRSAVLRPPCGAIRGRYGTQRNTIDGVSVKMAAIARR